MQGSLGASGDLVPLAHLTLPLVGLGEVEYEGKVISGGQRCCRSSAGNPYSLLRRKVLHCSTAPQNMRAHSLSGLCCNRIV